MNHVPTFYSQQVLPRTPLYWKTKQLYESSFPVVEQVSFEWMTKQAMKGQAEHRAYFDGALFCGFTISLVSDEVIYLLFLAVEPTLYSRGYGSKILRDVKKRAGHRPIYLVIEPRDETARNSQQREKRFLFYKRNGYHLTDYLYYENQEVYQVLTNKQDSSICSFKKVAKTIEESGLEIHLMKQINAKQIN